MDILGAYHIIGLYLRIISMHLGPFHSVLVHNGGYFWGLLKFQIFLGYLKFLVFFGLTVDAGPDHTYEEKMRATPPAPPPPPHPRP